MRKDALNRTVPVSKIFLRENHTIFFVCLFKDICWYIGASFRTMKANFLVPNYDDIDTGGCFVIHVLNMMTNSRRLYVEYFRDCSEYIEFIPPCVLNHSLTLASR